MKNIFRKFLICIVILGVLFSFSMPVAFAQQTSQVNAANILSDTGCSGPISCILVAIDYIAYFFFVIVGWFVGIAGNVMNFVLGISINNAFYTDIEPIKAGWTFSRDVVNVFFIFALLFIALSTILGIESYGAKALLAKFIIIALLVNFSLLASQAIIFVTNALAYQIYSEFPQTSNSFLLNSSDPKFNKDLTGALMQGLLNQKIFKAEPINLQVGPVATQAPKNATSINLAVLVTLVAAMVILAFAAFVFLAGAFLFTTRLVALWLLMILAPFGFVFLILPATKSYAQKWWSTIQAQALFAPAFMFFFAITVKIAQAGPLAIVNKALTQRPNTSVTELLFLLIIQNTIILFMLGGSLIIAKSLGIYGADGAIAMAQKGGKWFRGYAGRVTARTARRATTPAAERLLTGQGRIAPILRSIPGVAKGAATIVAAGRARTGEIQKNYEKFTSGELRQMMSGLQPMNRMAITQELVKRGDIGGVPENTLRQVRTDMQRQGMETRDLDRLDPRLATAPENIAPGATPAQVALAQTEMRVAARRMRPADVEKLDETLTHNDAVMDSIAATVSPQNIQKFVDRGGPFPIALTQALQRLAVSVGQLPTRAGIVVAMRDPRINNASAANWIDNTPAGHAFLP